MTATMVQQDRLTAQQIEGRMIAALATVRDLWDEMLEPTARRRGTGTSGDGAVLDDDSKSSADMPRTVVIVNARVEVAHELRARCRQVISTYSVRHLVPASDDVPGMCVFLARWAPRIVDHPDAAEVLDDFQTCASIVTRCAKPSAPDFLTLGPCPLMYDHPNLGSQQQCPGEVRSYGDENDGQSWATCTRCRQRAVASWWEKEMFGDDGTGVAGKTLTSTEVVTLAHRQFGLVLTQQAVWQWVKRGTLSPLDKDSKPHLFKVEDVVWVLSKKVQ